MGLKYLEGLEELDRVEMWHSIGEAIMDANAQYDALKFTAESYIRQAEEMSRILDDSVENDPGKVLDYEEYQTEMQNLSAVGYMKKTLADKMRLDDFEEINKAARYYEDTFDETYDNPDYLEYVDDVWETHREQIMERISEMPRSEHVQQRIEQEFEQQDPEYLKFVEQHADEMGLTEITELYNNSDPSAIQRSERLWEMEDSSLSQVDEILRITDPKHTTVKKGSAIDLSLDPLDYPPLPPIDPEFDEPARKAEIREIQEVKPELQRVVTQPQLPGSDTWHDGYDAYDEPENNDELEF